MSLLQCSNKCDITNCMMLFYVISSVIIPKPDITREAEGLTTFETRKFLIFTKNHYIFHVIVAGNVQINVILPIARCFSM